jgi:hypothetical protein
MTPAAASSRATERSDAPDFTLNAYGDDGSGSGYQRVHANIPTATTIRNRNSHATRRIRSPENALDCARL